MTTGIVVVVFSLFRYFPYLSSAYPGVKVARYVDDKAGYFFLIQRNICFAAGPYAGQFGS